MSRFVPIAVLVAFMFFVVSPGGASAASTPQCIGGPLNHTAMAGTYVGDDGSAFALNIYPCGGSSELFWTDAWGVSHTQKYQAVQAMDGGGWIGVIPPGGFSSGPWYTSAMGYKPAERGAIQILFWSDGELIVRHGRKA